MTRLLALFAQADWLDAPRLGRIVLVFGLFALAGLGADIWLHLRTGGVDATGEQLGRDFVNYWAGGHLAAQGQTVGVYDIQSFFAWQRANTAPHADFKWFSYPPVALLLSLPLALFGFATGYLVWLTAGFLACAAPLARTLGWRMGLFASIATPAAFMNAISGQNGAFTAAIIGSGVLLLERNPWLAGRKPAGTAGLQTASGAAGAVALAASGQWRAFLSTALSALALVAISALLFGLPTWMAFLEVAPINALLLERGESFWHRMPTIFSMARLMGGSVATAYGAQIASSIAAAVVTASVWRSQASQEMRGATLIFATFLATPYAWDYDMVWLTLAAVWMGAEAVRSEFRPWEKCVLMLILIVPMVMSPLARHTSLQIGPLVLWSALALAARRALKSRHQTQDHQWREETQDVLGGLHKGST